MEFKENLEFDQTLKFLKTISGRDNEVFAFAIIDEASKGIQPRHYIKKFSDIKSELVRQNRNGAGIFVMINQGDGQGRSKENVIAIRAFFLDDDSNQKIKPKMPPSIIVKSKRGNHYYWLLEDAVDLNLFTGVQKLLAKKFNTDLKVSDLPRLMRLPGFNHLKDPSSPFMVTVESCSGQKYQSEDFFKAFNINIKDLETVQKKSKRKTSEIDTKTASDFKNWFRKQPREISARNNTLVKILREALSLGFNDNYLNEIVAEYCNESGLDFEEGKKVLKYQKRYHAESNFTPFHTQIIADYDHASRAFLELHYTSEKGISKLGYWNGNFYEWTGRKYSILNRDDIATKLLSWSHGEVRFGFKFVSRAVNEIIFQMTARCLIDSTVSPNTFLGANSKGRFISVRNGVLNLNDILLGKNPELMAHSPDFFNFYSLEFDFKKNSKCDMWLRVIQKILPEADQRELLQKWFGYHLSLNLSHQKFMIFIGDGANGKSVVLKVLREFLGHSNISSVPLEQMCITRTFPLASMDGKMANIVEEISETDKVSEGLLKDLVSGGVVTVERKYQDPYSLIPSAKLTFATNNLPYIKDSSHGFWRRMLLLVFNVRIAEAEQEQKYSDPNFWTNSGELSGIFEWALEGFRALEAGKFNTPRSSHALMEEYKLDSNPFQEWLLENYDLVPNARTTIRSLRMHLQSDAGRGFQNVPSNSALKKEVKRIFKTVQWSSNPILQLDGTRSRCFIGMALKHSRHSTFSESGVENGLSSEPM